MELFLRLKSAQHGVIEVAKAAMYVYVNKESVSSSTIVIATGNSSLSPTSLFYLAPRIIEANWGRLLWMPVELSQAIDEMSSYRNQRISLLWQQQQQWNQTLYSRAITFTHRPLQIDIAFTSKLYFE